LTGRLRRLLYKYYLNRRLPLPDFLRNTYFLIINAKAEQWYRHQSYPGPMVVFRDQGPYPDPHLGWGRFVQGEITSYEIRVSVTDHRALMQEPAVREVAEKIEEYLAGKSSPIFVEYAQGTAARGPFIRAGN
jgi:hypothetical protein